LLPVGKGAGSAAPIEYNKERPHGSLGYTPPNGVDSIMKCSVTVFPSSSSNNNQHINQETLLHF